MKISTKWAEQLSNVPLMPNGQEELITKIGAQLGAVEGVIETGKRYAGVIVANIVSCKAHPDADRLHVCKIDDGGVAKDVTRDENGHIQVVCGAPNVHEAMLVAWLPPGTTVPSTYDKDPFVLGSRELRGVVSAGMLASPKELAINDDHAGILEIDPGLEVWTPKGASKPLPGMPFDLVYGQDDSIIDVENKMFTHRPDCFGLLGVARELAGIQQQQFKSPDWYLNQPSFSAPQELPLSVQNELPELVPRFMAVVMKNIVIAPSPIWLQAGLARIGMKPINNVVDITNYLMYLTAQPLHAYDYDKVAAKSVNGATLVVRFPKPGEKIALLNGKTIEPHNKAIMISSNQELLGIGGIMGGTDTEVDVNTKNIIIECATFDMYSVRRTSMTHGLFTEAVTRFNKGQSPLQNDRVLAKAMELMKQMAGTQQASEVYDVRHTTITNKPSEIEITSEFVNARLGLSLSADKMKSLLENVEFAVKLNTNSTLLITVPFWRMDIEIAEDIVEEVGRLHGYDNLQLVLPHRDLTPVRLEPMAAFKKRIRQILRRAGTNEMLNYSFVHGDLIERSGQNKDNAFQLSNALSPDLQYYRLSLIPSLLDKVQGNIRAGYSPFGIYEMNKVHTKQHASSAEGVPVEFQNLGFVYAADERSKSVGPAFYQARVALDYLAQELGIDLAFMPLEDKETIDDVTKPFEVTRSAVIIDKDSGVQLGIIGEFKPGVRKYLKLPTMTAGFELRLVELFQAAPTLINYQSLSRFPKVSQDITLCVSSDVAYGGLIDLLNNELESLMPEKCTAELKPLGIYQSKSDKEHKNVSLRLTIVSYNRTLTTDEVNALLDKLAAFAHSVLRAERI